MSTRKPSVGDRIEHIEPQFSRSTVGTVTVLLSAQFAYVSDDGHSRMCLYKEQWKQIAK